MTLFGLIVDALNDNGPMLSPLLAGIGFARLYLKLLEQNDKQLHTIPNLLTFIRIGGIVAVTLRSLHFGDRDEPSSFVLSDGICGVLGFLFVALDFLDGYLARQLQQATAFGAHLDAHADALGTAFLAITLRAKGRMTSGLALHMAAAAYVFPLVQQAIPKNHLSRIRHAKEPWARPCAGLMAMFAVLGVLLPGIASSLGDQGNDRAALRLLIASGRISAELAGVVSAVSFLLSYLTLAGFPVPGNRLKAGVDQNSSKTN